MPIIHGADRPADDEPRVQVQDRREIQLVAAADDELRRVADPPLIRRGGRELPIEQIGRDRLVVIAHRRELEPPPHAASQAVLLHQPDDPLAADRLAVLDQVLRECAGCRSCAGWPRRTRAPSRAAGRRAARGRRGRSATRRSHSGDTQTPTEDRHRMPGLLRRDEREPHRLCFAKKAAAFFRMSRSSCELRFSLRSRASSSRSAVVRPVLPFVRSARARLTQSPQRRVSVRSRSRATAPTRLALVEDQAHRAGLELISELPARPALGACLPSVWTSYPPFGRCPRNRIKPIRNCAST